MSPQVILNSFSGNTALGGSLFRSFLQLEAGGWRNKGAEEKDTPSQN